MTSEEKNERNRVIKRLANAKTQKYIVVAKILKTWNETELEKLRRQHFMVCKKIRQIEATLRGYDAP